MALKLETVRMVPLVVLWDKMLMKMVMVFPRYATFLFFGLLHWYQKEW